MFLLYDFVLLLYALIYLPYLLLTRRLHEDYAMRFGLFPAELQDKVRHRANIWVHAVSVGEVLLIDGFIDRLKENHPGYQVVVTVTTKTGYVLARERLQSKAFIIPAPIDFSFIAETFASLIRPRLYIAVETEIWPNLYEELYRRHTPMVVINGRISENSFKRYKMIRFLLKRILNQVSIWCMQSQLDAERIMDLGAESSRVKITGNLKFDDHSEGPKPLFNLLSKNERWWIAGSTHPGEEEKILDVYEKVIKDNPKWRLVIAPRHVERVPQLMGIISLRGLKAVKLSQYSLTSRDAQAIIIVDTIGQLRSLYSVASLVFVGKSLFVGGGQNVIEPASYGKAIIVGPKCENFKDVVACFREHNAIVQVDSVDDFETEVMSLCFDVQRREALGAAALEVIATNQGAAVRTLECLAGFLK